MNKNTNTKRHTVNLEDNNIRVSGFHPLKYPIEEIHIKNTTYDDAKGMTNDHIAVPNRKKAGTQTKQSPKRPPVVVKRNPENERYFTKTMPGNSTYADIMKEGKNTCIIGDSIVKE